MKLNPSKCTFEVTAGKFLDNECDVAFEQMKTYLGKPPLFCSPVEGEELFLYLAASDFAVAAVLVREEGGSQRLIYYVSKALSEVEARYFNAENLAYALVGLRCKN